MHLYRVRLCLGQGFEGLKYDKLTFVNKFVLFQTKYSSNQLKAGRHMPASRRSRCPHREADRISSDEQPGAPRLGGVYIGQSLGQLLLKSKPKPGIRADGLSGPRIFINLPITCRLNSRSLTSRPACQAEQACGERSSGLDIRIVKGPSNFLTGHVPAADTALLDGYP